MELPPLLVHGQLLGRIRPHCGQHRAQRGLSTGHRCPAWGRSPPRRPWHPDPHPEGVSRTLLLLG